MKPGAENFEDDRDMLAKRTRRLASSGVGAGSSGGSGSGSTAPHNIVRIERSSLYSDGGGCGVVGAAAQS